MSDTQLNQAVNSIAQATNNLNQTVSNLNQTMANVFPQQGATATTATAGAATLPANPVGFLSVVINGVTRKFPYYA